MFNFEMRPVKRNSWDAEFDKFFDTLSQKNEFYAPAYEVIEGEKEFTISLDIPGMKKEDIALEVKDNHLYIQGERKFEKKSEKDSIIRSEKRYGKFSRVFTLPQNVKAENIEARFSNGVLEIGLPKEEKAVARKITISDWRETAAEAGLN
jgi:HSP20 family protein